ncbi:hypothetical protein [Deinococcus altitudinis]|uniref:hypothetical protein n=1 Tax=Deinococcus altitudinis TaxID=468914 RepID=UPI003892556F
MTNIQAGSTGSRNGGLTDIDLIDSERALNEANSKHRISWAGIFVGLITGVTLLVVLGTLGVAIGASTANSLTGLGIGAIIWTALTVLISAYMAGYTAVRAGNQGLASSPAC